MKRIEPGYYQQQADDCRLTAHQARSADTRTAWLQVAAEWDRLATEAKKIRRQGDPPAALNA